jgi:hypothetical protein
MLKSQHHLRSYRGPLRFIGGSLAVLAAVAMVVYGGSIFAPVASQPQSAATRLDTSANAGGASIQPVAPMPFDYYPAQLPAPTGVPEPHTPNL